MFWYICVVNPTDLFFFQAETIMYPEVLPQHISYWYIILAAVLGILVLGLLIFVLYKCGFFKRKRAKDATLKGAIITEENKELLWTVFNTDS